MDYSDMSLVSYLGSVKLMEKSITLNAIQEPLFNLYTKHIKPGQLSRLQERHLAISRAGITLRWKANDKGPPESCLLSISMDSLIYCNAVSFQTISSEAYLNEMKIKKSKKRKENYGSFQPVGDIDCYSSSLFNKIKKPFAYLHEQAYKPLIFIYVNDALVMHAIICKGEQEDVIHKVRVCDNLKRDSYEDEKAIYQSRNMGQNAPSNKLYYGASEIISNNRSQNLYSTQSDTYQNDTRHRDSRSTQNNGSSQEREESPYYQRHLPSPEVAPEVVPEEQLYRKLPINKVLPTDFISQINLREITKDKSNHVLRSTTPDLISSSSSTNGNLHRIQEGQSTRSQVKSFPNQTSNLRPITKHQTSCPERSVPPPPNGRAPNAPANVYNSSMKDHFDSYEEELFDRSIVMKGTKDEEIVNSFSGINLSTQNTSFDMNNLHDALGYLP